MHAEVHRNRLNRERVTAKLVYQRPRRGLIVARRCLWPAAIGLMLLDDTHGGVL